MAATVRDPTLSLTQLCALVKTTLGLLIKHYYSTSVTVRLTIYLLT